MATAEDKSTRDIGVWEVKDERVARMHCLGLVTVTCVVFSWQMPAAFNWTRSNAKIGQDHCSLQGLQNPCVCSLCINAPLLRGI